MFSKSAQYYDDLYRSMGKDYSAEANKINKYIQEHIRTSGNALLDVACGTGIHAGLLSKQYKVEGIDLDANMLKVARKNYPKIRFHQGDMRYFDLGRQFDIVTCLFSAIGYMKNKSELRRAVKNMGRHLLPGGVLIVEAWFTPEQWNPGRVSTLLVDKPDLKIVRMSRGSQRGKISMLDFQYLVGTPKGINHMNEHHEFGLFTSDEYVDAFKSSALKVTYDKKGLEGRGLYIGTKATK